MKKKAASLVAAFLMLYAITHGQNYSLPVITPKSPNVASFERYGEIPVAMSTGIPQVDIPLTEINVDGISLPVALSYHCNGYKPKDIASWAGYGWNLQVGGSITWEMQGLADFGMGGMQSTYGVISKYRRGANTPEQTYWLMEDIMKGLQDTEWDHFSLSLLGNNYLFYFDTLGKALITPKSDLKISVIQTGGYKLLDDKGNEFFFESAEGGSSEDIYDIDLRQAGASTTYYVSRIITKNRREIRFRYKTYNYSYNQSAIIKKYRHSSGTQPWCPVSGPDYSSTHIKQGVLLLDSIVYDDGYIKFETTSANRLDLYMFAPIELPSLSAVKVVNNKGRMINQFFLEQSYFGTNDKLKLDAVREQVNSTVGRRWDFTYYDKYLAPYNTTSIDHWGYFNGKDNNGLTPEADYAAWAMPAQGTADRTSNFEYARRGMLKSIRFPTGGSTTFEYEPNQVRVPSKKIIEDWSPFLRWGKNAFPTVIEWLGSGNSNTNPTGSFTLTKPTLLTLSFFYELDPGYVQDASIQFSGPKPGLDSLNAAVYSVVCRPNPYCSAQRNVTVAPGTYTWTCVPGRDTYASGDERILWSNIDITHSYLDTTTARPPFELPGGRIKRMVSTDSSGVNPPIIKEYVYNDTLPNVSIKNIPNYMTSLNYNVPDAAPYLNCVECGPLYSFSEENIAPFSGSTIEYGKVTELYDSSGRGGKIDYTYSLSDNIQGEPMAQPNVKPFNTFWTAGRLLKKEVYKNIGNNYAKVSETINSFTSSDLSGIMPGMKVNYATYCSNSSYSVTPSRIHRANAVYIGATRYNQTSSIERFFASDTISVENSFTYGSAQHTQLTSQQSLNSKGQAVRKQVVYPVDYVNRSLATIGDALTIRNLADSNRVVPIETISVKSIAGADYIIDGTIEIYSPDRLNVKKVFEWKSASPVLLSTYTKSAINGSGVFTMDARYQEMVAINRSDEFGNPCEIQKNNDQVVTTIYDYKKLYPIAQIINADSSSVAYTSFEADGTGNWIVGSIQRITNDGFTGFASYQLANGSLTKTGLVASKEYLVSYWTKNAASLSVAGTQGVAQLTKQLGAWRCFTHRITGVTQIVLSGTAILDEVRLHPATAKMQTWCHEPQIGIVSQCSVNQVPTYYEYDPLGRLVLIRDQNNNILKKVDYQLRATE
jgi:hypothetical protein